MKKDIKDAMSVSANKTKLPRIKDAIRLPVASCS